VPVGLWQDRQLTDVGKWVDGLVDAAVPLWQRAQFGSAVNRLWLGLAPNQLLVLWQVSQLVVAPVVE
jgi:hypothetical protein